MSKLVNITAIVLVDTIDDALKQCVASLDWCQEILVVLTRSNIALPNSKPWNTTTILKLPQPSGKITDFGKVRNRALQEASQEWVFFVDSDEVVQPGAAEKISKHIERGQYDGLLVRRSDVFHNQALKGGEAANVWLLRVGKKKLMSYGRPVHELATISGTIAKVDVKLLHHSHQSLNSFLEKISYYSQLEANYRIQQHRTASTLELLFFPPLKLIYNLLFRLGLRDGWRGVAYAYMMSLHSLCVRVYQYEKTNVDPS